MALSDRQVTGIVLIVLGVLAVSGVLGSVILAVAGVLLVVYGALILTKKAKGESWLGAICIVGGILLLAGYLPVLGAAVQAIAWVVGVVLIVLGILKLVGK